MTFLVKFKKTSGRERTGSKRTLQSGGAGGEFNPHIDIFLCEPEMVGDIKKELFHVSNVPLYHYLNISHELGDEMERNEYETSGIKPSSTECSKLRRMETY